MTMVIVWNAKEIDFKEIMANVLTFIDLNQR
jgi:hypothetical protein